MVRNPQVRECQTNEFSCPAAWSSSQSKRHQQRDSRTRRRHVLCCLARDYTKDDVHPNSLLPDPPPDKALLRPHLGHLRWSCNTLRLRLLPVRLARPRKGHSPGDHPLLSPRAQRPPLPRRFPAPRRRRPCFPLPAPLHGGRIPHQDRLHDILARVLPHGLRPARAGQQASPDLLTR